MSLVSTQSIVHVAVGLVVDGQDRVLLTRRAANQHQGGLWEFPGGKLEAGEQIADTLRRELREELGIVVIDIEPFIKVEHDYGDKCVLLDVWRVNTFSGEATGLEGQPLAWVALHELGGYPLPAANVPIVDKLLADRLGGQ